MIPKLAIVFILALIVSEVLSQKRKPGRQNGRKPGRKPQLPICGCPTSISLKEAFCPPPQSCTKPPMRCPRGKKCCATCNRPLTKHCLTPTNPNKPGVCPKVTLSARAEAIIRAPLPQKRGLLIAATTASRCGRPCVNDCDCDGNQKCCNAGICGKICMNPVKPKNRKTKIAKCGGVSMVPTSGTPGFPGPGGPTSFAVGLACCCDGACASCVGNCCIISSPTCATCA